MKFSEHAQQRINQRGISPFVVDLIMEFGDVEYHQGKEIFRISRKAERRLDAYLGAMAGDVKRSLKDIYIVAADDRVVTVARQTRHMKRERH